MSFRPNRVIANNIQNRIKSNQIITKSISKYINDKSKKEKSSLLGLREDGGKNVRERINREGEGRPNQHQQQQIRKKQQRRQQQQSNKKQIGMKKKQGRRGRRIRRREEATDNREEGKEREEANRRRRRIFFYFYKYNYKI